MCSSFDHSLICLADSGTASAVLVWDNVNMKIRNIWFNPHKSGTSALAFSPVGNVLATLSLSEHVCEPQFIRLFEVGSEAPLTSISVGEEHIHDTLRFNPWDPTELLTSGKNQVLFWKWDSARLKKYTPILVKSEFKYSVKQFTQSLFLKSSAISATVDGDVLVWQIADAADGRKSERRAAKLVKLCRQGEPTVLSSVNGFFAMGCSDGGVRIFDDDLRIVAWFENIKLGAIASVSFKQGTGLTPFYVITDSSTVARVSPNDGAVTVVLNAFDSPVSGIGTIPDLNLLVISTTKCLHLWNLEKRYRKLSIDFEKSRSSTLAVSRSSIAVGFTTGLVMIFSTSGDQIGSVKVSGGLVSHLMFDKDSCDSLVAVVDGTLFLISADTSNSWRGVWELRAHDGKISGVDWLPGYRLLTVGTDGTLVETVGSVAGGRLMRKIRVSEGSLLLGLRAKHDAIEVFDSEFKIRTISIDKKGDLICKRLRLGPIFYDSANSIMSIPAHIFLQVGEITAFACGGYVGVSHDQGEPFGIIAQPSTSNVCMAVAGDRLFASGHTGVLSEFKIVCEHVSRGDPMHGAISDELARQARELFCLCQIKARGENSTLGRRLDGKLSIVGLQEALNGLGYFPSEWELGNMANELDSEYLTFEDYLRLFIHYRPVTSLQPKLAVDIVRGRGLTLEDALTAGNSGYDSQIASATALKKLAALDPGFLN